MTLVLDPPRPIDAVALTVSETPLPLAPDERIAVERRFEAALAANPKLWNGAFFLFEDVALGETTFTATARPTDFATFLHWRAAAEPDRRWTHVFPVAALTTRDDRLLLGIMGATTANPGLAYPPSGSFDPDDVVDGRLDPLANMLRELREEVGLDAAAFPREPGYTVFASGPRRVALVKRIRAPLVAEEIEAAIRTHVAEDPHGELGGHRFVGFDERLPDGRTVPYVNRLLARLAAERDAGR